MSAGLNLQYILHQSYDNIYDFMPKRGRLGSRGKVRAQLGQNAPVDVGLMVHENIRVTKCTGT
jgi:hypothetical protein